MHTKKESWLQDRGAASPTLVTPRTPLPKEGRLFGKEIKKSGFPYLDTASNSWDDYRSKSAFPTLSNDYDYFSNRILSAMPLDNVESHRGGFSALPLDNKHLSFDNAFMHDLESRFNTLSIPSSLDSNEPPGLSSIQTSDLKINTNRPTSASMPCSSSFFPQDSELGDFSFEKPQSTLTHLPREGLVGKDIKTPLVSHGFYSTLF